jgi:hypothetical protein
MHEHYLTWARETLPDQTKKFGAAVDGIILRAINMVM